MIWTFLSSLTGDLWPYLAAAGAALAAIAGAWLSGRKAGKSAVEIKGLKDDARKQEEGRKAVRSLRGADRNQSARQLRDNDRDWK